MGGKKREGERERERVSTYHGGQDALKNSAQDIEDIANKPNYDELHGEGIGAAALEVLDDLWGEDDDWQSS